MSPSALPEPTREMLELLFIRTDGGTQPREEIDLDTVDTYAEDIVRGDQFPPLRVFYDGVHYWLSDGFHRLFAYKKTGSLNQMIECEVFQGTQRDAILDSLGANARHGLPRTTLDKRAAVQRLLTDPEWKQWSDGAIAEKANVSQPFVSKLRRNLPLLDGDSTQNVLSGHQAPPEPATRISRAGRAIATGNIGRRVKVSPAQTDIAFAAPSNERGKQAASSAEPDGWRDLPLIITINVKPGKADKRGIMVSGKAGAGKPIFLSSFTTLDLLPTPPALAALITDLQKAYARTAKTTASAKSSKSPSKKSPAKAKARKK